MNAVTVVALALSLAQVPAVQPASKLTLAEALEAAEKRSINMRVVESLERQVDEVSAQAWSYYLPQVSASGTLLKNEKKVAIPAGTFGPDEVVIQEELQKSAQVDVSQVLLAPALAFSIRGAHRAEDAGMANLETARRAVRFGVAQAFYATAALAKAVSASERLLEIAQRQEKDAKVRFQAGTIAKVGLLRAEIDRARAEQDLKRASNSYESARLTLADLLDRPADFELVEPPPPAPIVGGAELEERALAARPDVAAARATVDSNRAFRNSYVAGYLPNVAAFGRYSISNSAGFTGDNSTWIMGLSATWNIFDGGLRESKWREGNAKLDEAELRLEATEKQVRLEVRQALLDQDSAQANASKAKEQRELAAENQRLVDVSYKAGASTAVEQADATAQLRTAEFGAQAEELSAQIATLKVLQIVGAKTPAP